MPKYNASSTLVEPIEFDLNGKTFVIKKVTQSLLDAVSAVPKDDGTVIDLLRVIVCAAGGCADDVVDVDIREAHDFLTWFIKEAVKLPDAEKNAGAA